MERLQEGQTTKKLWSRASKHGKTGGSVTVYSARQFGLPHTEDEMGLSAPPQQMLENSVRSRGNSRHTCRCHKAPSNQIEAQEPVHVHMAA